MKLRFLVVLIALLGASATAWAQPAPDHAEPTAKPAASAHRSAEPASLEQADGSPSLSQRIDGVFSPLAKGASKVMFWDPFEAMGIYDATLRDEQGRPLVDEQGEPRRAPIPLVVVWLIAAALYFTLRMRFINVRGFVHAVALIRGKFHDPTAPGEVSHFQALATAVSGTVGLGNIAGVAIAISLGGPGATFWMALAGFFGMATKFTECTLGVKYREIDEAGVVRGGPMYYLKKGLAKRRIGSISLAPLGVFLGGTWALFAVLGSLGGGNMFQANQSFAMASELFPFLKGHGAYYGMALAVAVGLVIIGGIQGIGKVTGKVVPFMALLYVTISLIIIAANILRIGDVFAQIVAGAFAAPAVKGGFVGVMVIGLRRAAFSNEAGVGTAAIAHSTAQTREPVAEGVVGLHEPFIDTVVICTMTALVLIFTGFADGPQSLQGAALTAAAFGSVVSWFPYLLTVAILLFSFSTLISFAYYGQQCFDYCFGWLFEKAFGNRQIAIHIFRVIFLLCTVVGASSEVDAVVAYSDMIIFGLAFTNTTGLFILSTEVRQEMLSYLDRLERGAVKRAAA